VFKSANRRLIDRWSAYRGHDEQAIDTQTICVGCSIGCGINVFTRDNNLLRIDGNWDAPVNEGVICEIGRFKPMNEKCDRLVTPMIRKTGRSSNPPGRSSQGNFL